MVENHPFYDHWSVWAYVLHWITDIVLYGFNELTILYRCWMSLKSSNRQINTFNEEILRILDRRNTVFLCFSWICYVRSFRDQILLVISLVQAAKTDWHSDRNTIKIVMHFFTNVITIRWCRYENWPLFRHFYKYYYGR